MLLILLYPLLYLISLFIAIGYIGILGSSHFFSNILLNIASSSYFLFSILYPFYFAGVLLFLLYILILPLYSLFFCMMAESDYII